MTQKAKLLCPIDFSHGSEFALFYANKLASTIDAEVHCVHVIDPTPYGTIMEGAYVSSGSVQASIDRIEEHVKKEFTKTLHKYSLLHLEAQGHFIQGDPAQEVIKLADELAVDYIIMATHGRTGFDNWVFGSTCEKIVRLSHVPIITLKHPKDECKIEELDVSFNRILCPLDFSDFSKKGLEPAVDLCKRFDATLVLAHAIDNRLEYPLLEPGLGIQTMDHFETDANKYLQEIADSLEGVKVEILVESGNPYKVLVNIMENESIDLVVMTTHGYRGLTHLLLGSNAERLVKLAPCPVLTIHPDKDAKRVG
jgi:nucleotide-binding universal stress UspA family protein